MFNLHTHTKNPNAIINIDDFSTFKAERNDYYSLGNHPWQEALSITTIEKAIRQHSNIIAIGECGLDKHKSYDTFEVQIDIFKQQVALSEKLKLPIILHLVKSYTEILQLKKELKPKQPWVIHGFNKYKHAVQLIESGFYLSFGASLLTNTKLQSAFTQTPIAKIFLETDAATITIQEMYIFAAQLRQVTVAELKHQISNNCKTVFKWKIG